MKIAFITGSSGLVGTEAVQYFANKGFKVIGIDNDLRKYFFGREASVKKNTEYLQKTISNYTHHNLDIRDVKKLTHLFKKYNTDIKLIIHTSTQPSHDWAAREPLTDFSINAQGTLHLLELTRQYCPKSVFIFTSTNKVYGDLPNTLSFREGKTRFDLLKSHPFYNGIDESMSIDQSKHSLFGASKLAADILVQEYGRYFGLKTASFRAGCISGSRHKAVELHGFLSYLMKCAITGKSYTIFGYKGKQVRDNIHSYDLVCAFDRFYHKSRRGEVYNIGGGRGNSCSILEAINLCEKITGKKLKYHYHRENRSGDHKWYITNFRKFKDHYPRWKLQYDLEKILSDIYQNS